MLTFMNGKFSKVIILCIGISACDYNFVGPTINNNNSNSNNNENKFDIHDLINFAPVPNPTTPVPAPGTGVETPLPLPVTAQAIAQKVADTNPTLLSKSCPETYGETGWAFLDLVVKTLQASDMRWGYLVKQDGTISRDVIAYRATSDNTGAWGVDIIIDRCGTASKFSWQVLGFDPLTVWSLVRTGFSP